MVEILDIDTLHEGWSTFRLVRFRLEDGTVLQRSIEDHGDAVIVLPYDPERRVALLVRQFRAQVRLRGEDPFPEAPAGIIEAGEDPADCGRREAMEETGVRLDAMESIGRYWASPGSTTERSHLFLAPYTRADLVGEGGGVDEHEDTEAEEVPLQELARRLDRGELQDVKLLALVLSLMRKRPELFA